jgi:hypothetical protein
VPRPNPENREAPDFAGVLKNGRRLEIELVRVVDPTLAKIHSDIHDRFVPELQEACRLRSVAATIHLSFAEWDASRLRERGHQARREVPRRACEGTLRKAHEPTAAGSRPSRVPQGIGPTTMH